MLAQYGKEVLYTVRLEEARKHKMNAKEILANINVHTDKDSAKILNYGYFRKEALL